LEKLTDENKIEILFENEDLIAADKPAGISSIAENDTALDTLHSLLEKKYSQRLFIVHRLDKEVSGVILFAKNPRTHKFINDQFAGRTVKKYYSAIVHGIINESDGVIRKPIREFGSGRMGVDDRKGKPSETKFKVVERFKDFTLLDLNPSTGRRHQLRVHLYSINHPIVGDLRYGEKTMQEKFPRIMLHARSLQFKLYGGKEIYVEASLPPAFSEEAARISKLI